MGYGCTQKEAEGMSRKAYKAMTSHWDEENEQLEEIEGVLWKR